MRLNPQDLEPVTPDPRKLWLTAGILVLVMIFGGALVLKAYERYTQKQSANERAAMNTNRLTPEKDLPLVRQDGSRGALLDLSGKVIVIQVVAAGDLSISSRSNEVMKRVAEQYASQADCALVSLVIDPGPAENARAVLESAAADLGAKFPQWWVATNQPELLHKYLKKEFKASIFPHNKDGKWIFDTSVVVVDRNGVIRQPVVPQKQGGPPYVGPFDFDQAATWDERGVKTGTDRNNVGELQHLLLKTIDELLAEPVKKS